MKEIDNRNLGCPEPVLRTRKAIEEHGPALISIVDNEIARDNVLRFARSQGLNASCERKGDDFHICITAPTEESTTPSVLKTAPPEKPVFLIGNDQLGSGSEELGRLLMRNFIYTLTQRDSLPGTLIFVNAGVKLTTEGSPVLEELALLEERDVSILSCGTCLDYYGLKESLCTGQVSNMYDISELLGGGSPVITL